MAIKAIVFDIGGVLEHTPDTGMMEKWEERLALPAGEFSVRVMQAWGAGALEDIPASVLHQNLCEATGMDDAQANAFTEDFWKDYLGIPIPN
ncbi:hypothetical protein KDW_56530 [Dictyobacter vulcani]|uniref:Haloacid dehalogenase n=1 Tax=Dictyobacter vulcani TaxID=2607529 RepID=A0A5J4KYB4_9CHLR|nr:hypothetical protein [Dictyobacter vulcani]GER91491.1 hypothetical protein KDW_56530 [Dictyobacter vulcani]